MLIGPKSLRQEILTLRREAEADGALRVARRLHAIQLNLDGNSSLEISQILDVHRANISLWLRNWEENGLEGVLEGQRAGRPKGLSRKQEEHLARIIEAGPVEYGFASGVWTSPMMAEVIRQEFNTFYHPGHVRKLVSKLGFSVQRPKRQLARADPEAQERWRRYTYPNLKKKRRLGARS